MDQEEEATPLQENQGDLTAAQQAVPDQADAVHAPGHACHGDSAAAALTTNQQVEEQAGVQLAEPAGEKLDAISCDEEEPAGTDAAAHAVQGESSQAAVQDADYPSNTDQQEQHQQPAAAAEASCSAEAGVTPAGAEPALEPPAADASTSESDAQPAPDGQDDKTAGLESAAGQHEEASVDAQPSAGQQDSSASAVQPATGEQNSTAVGVPADAGQQETAAGDVHVQPPAGQQENAAASVRSAAGEQDNATAGVLCEAGQQQSAAAADPASGREHDQVVALHAEVPVAAAEDAFSALGGADASRGRQPSKTYFVDGVRAIDVEVDCGPGLPCKLLHVTMDVSALQSSTKPYLGGYKHKQEGTIFHHASIQTPQDQGPNKKGHKQLGAAAGAAAAAVGQEQAVCMQQADKLTRDTQTVQETICSSQTVREASTQMAAPGLLLDCSGDRVLTPRPYVTSDAVQQYREAAAMVIQRFTRGWFARKRAATLRGIKAERDEFLAETAADSANAAFEHKRREVERRTHPLSKADFELLQSELEAWRQSQTAAIKAAGLVPQEEQAALQLLLAKETRLLQTLDRLRTAAHQERRSSGRQKTLGALAQPKTWTMRNGKKVLVHTPLTVRAAELQQLYRGLTLAALSLDERLDVLLHVKWVSKEWDSSLTWELVELIDREADLLNRGRSPKTLGGLRKRIAGLFLTCCQNPAFNPEAARLRVNAVGPNGPEAFEYVMDL